MTEADRGYVAGMIDGEGSIGVVAEKLNGHDGSLRSHRFCSSVTVSNTNSAMLEKIQRVTGVGEISSRIPNADRGQRIYRWRCPRAHIRALLEEIEPYLGGKNEQAQLVLEFLDLQDAGRKRGHKGLSEQDVPRALEIYQHLRALHGGCSAVPLAIVISTRDGKPRQTECSEPGCAQRRYHRWLWCYTHWLQNKPPVGKSCAQCGERFETRNDLKRYCSDLCQARHTADVTKGKDRERHKLITEEQVKRAIDLLLTGAHTQTDVAKALGVDRPALGDILRGRSRKEWKLDLPTKEQLNAGHEIWRKRRQATTEKVCEQCGKTFNPVSGRMRFCGKACWWIGEKARRRAAYAAAGEAT